MSKTSNLLARREAAVAFGAATAHPVFVDRAIGSEIWDVDGKHYVDFASGIAVMNTGHQHPAVTQAVTTQLSKYGHVAFPVNSYAPYVEVCERLNAVAPIKNAKSALFTTGAEAVENAIKIARIATGRLGVITFTGSFHGRTQLAMTMTGKVAPLRTGVPPTQPGVFQLPFPMPQHGTTERDTIKALDHLFRASIAPDQVAAIVIEPVQGEGGFYRTPNSLMNTLREICDTHGILLIVDEIQSGFGRTGRFFAIEHYEVEPDLITVGKAIGGGLPLAGVVGKAEIIGKPLPGALGGTFAGNPLACAAALAVFDVIEKENLLAAADRIGSFLAGRLEVVRDRNDVVPIGEIRQIGAMVAFEIVKERGAHEPDAEATKLVAAKARDEGVLLLPCGYYGNTIRLSAALTASDEILDEGLGRLTKALVQIAANS
ncbi:4-aminobutyrate--2-oxoglutarate transaminase [Rhizobium leguminosarum bv. trifolii]|uniref:4-aminobutyrate--2-oxoglutarate transaminase n=1 Tax=Rhizobium leguminosarum bv. trifolii TaxID=386 RepID=A0A3E1BJA3_RHILT|nr:aspartate aminotransferase family protein [Rhizobium leguminosarum]RFB91359.1 4-aminobutyrate--2-oxoglutarate transaminase [Rhizobium leguminosarum bv. trifolii]RFB92984.1 4-aminobutyrate--2-oxoglutarate transaminase [Rhizobium leguminosarum bv. trifolii]